VKKNGFAPKFIIVLVLIVGIFTYLFQNKNRTNIVLTLGTLENNINPTGNFLAIEVNIQNKSNKDINVSPNDFLLLDASGKIIGKVKASGGKNPYLPTTNLKTGSKLTGNLTFIDVPSNFTKGVLKFQLEDRGATPIELPVNFGLPATGK